MESDIIGHYKSCGKVLETWEKYKDYFSRYQITDILRRNGILNRRGGAYNNADELVIDNSREFKYLTDDDLDFENEIKTKLF